VSIEGTRAAEGECRNASYSLASACAATSAGAPLPYLAWPCAGETVGEHRPFEWGRGFVVFPGGSAVCSAGCVLCVLWAMSAAVCVGGGTLWG